MRRIGIVLLAAAACGPPVAVAEDAPLWEFGLGPTALSLPDYRGSDQRRGYIYPFPYIVYRGDVFRVTGRGVRGLLFESDAVELDISGYATPPVRQGSNTARQGMPDLDATVELGPALNWHLARWQTLDARLDLRLPLRVVIATDLKHASWEGLVFYPNLNLDLYPHWLGGRWSIGLAVGPVFGSRQYHEYFYSVAPQYATPTRPAYNAPGGYSGTAFLAAVSRRFGEFWVGGYVRYDALRGTSFEESPLVLRDSSFAAGFAIAWVFAESKERVEVRD